MSNAVEDTLSLLKSIQAQGSNDALAKSITTGAGLVAYDLQAPSKNLYPVYTPLRNVIPRTQGGIGLATNWRVVSAITGSGYDSQGWVPEGQRSGRMSYTTANKSASYVTLGEEDSITFEAEAAGVGFEDLSATMRMRLLQKLMLKEEAAILGGNASLTLATPTAPTTSASGSGYTLPTSSTYSVIVVALTFEGYRNSSLSNGVATAKVVTGADGDTYAINGGCSAQSAASSAQAITLGQALLASTPAVNGAVAYAWFVGATSGTEKLEAITTLNSVAFTAPLTAGSRQAATVVTGDFSRNPNLAYDGLLTSAFTTGSGAYVKSLATGVAGTGTTLTSSGRGSVVEIDTMLQSMYDTSQVSPTVLYVNSQQLKDITTKVLNGSSAPLLRYDAPATGTDPYAMIAGGTVAFYFNPFSNTGGYKIPVRVHPFVPAGTIIGWTGDLPAQYMSNNVPNVAEVRCRKDYYSIDFPLKTRKRETGVYCESTMAIYAPFCLSVINNVAAG